MQQSRSYLWQLTISVILSMFVSIAQAYPPFEDSAGNLYYFLGEMGNSPRARALSQHNKENHEELATNFAKFFHAQTQEILWLNVNPLQISENGYIRQADYYRFAQRHQLTFNTHIEDTDYILDPNLGSPQLIIHQQGEMFTYPLVVTDRDQPNNGRFSLMFRSEDPHHDIIGAIEPRESYDYGKPIGCLDPITQGFSDKTDQEILKNYYLYLNLQGTILTNCTTLDRIPQAIINSLDQAIIPALKDIKPIPNSSKTFSFQAENFEPSWNITLTENTLKLNNSITDVLKEDRRETFSIKTKQKNLNNAGNHFVLTFQATEVPEVYGIISPGDYPIEEGYTACQISQEAGSYNIVFHYYDYIFTGCAERD